MSTVTTENIAGLAGEVTTVEIEAVEPAPFEVLDNNIVVEFIEREDVTDSGIVLAGVQKTRPPECVVVGAGPNAYVQTHNGDELLEVGHVLIVRKHELMRLELGDDGRELHITKPSGVIGIIR